MRRMRASREQFQLIDYLIKFCEQEERFSFVQTKAAFAPVISTLNNIAHGALNSQSALPCFLSGQTHETDVIGEDPVIFPFGCNQSQKKAVENALKNSLSVIQGPPGTGKTQTILNIIANLLIRGKTVAVASNNNAATENVKEKLGKKDWGLDWLVAELGSREIRSKFFSNLPQINLDPDWGKLELKTQEIQHLTQIIDTYYDKQLHRQEIIRRLDELALQSTIFTEEAGKLKDNHWYPQLIKHSWKRLDLIEHWVHSINSGHKNLSYYWSRFNLFLNGIRLHNQIQAEIDTFLDTLVFAKAERKREELQTELENLGKWLKKHDKDEKKLIELSKQFLFRKIFDRYYRKIGDHAFSPEGYRKNATLYKRYPITISSTFALPFSCPWKGLFDYLIIDEASQVNIAAGAACLNCAKNAVIVGDSKQLPMIVKSESKALPEVPSAYDATKNTILDSVIAAVGKNLPTTILREHYRCHPDIIEFCNRRFYKGQLIPMTKRDEGKIPFEWIQMSASHITYNKSTGSYFNERQIDETQNKVRELKSQGLADDEIGIVAPYREHALKVKKGDYSKLISDTVHKFQGRETDVIIFDVVQNDVNDFIDDPNLINVAVSRAKDQFILVSTPLENRKDSNIGALIEYISHLDPASRKITQSTLRSVFDVLYSKEETQSVQTHQGESPAEALFRDLLNKVLKEFPSCSWSFIQEYPLRLLPSTLNGFSDEEKRFMRNGSRLDFLLYDRMNNQPIAAFEVDGASFHQKGSNQDRRDKLKNNILKSINIPLIRFRTDTVTGNEEAELRKFLFSVYCGRNTQNKSETKEPGK